MNRRFHWTVRTAMHGGLPTSRFEPSASICPSEQFCAAVDFQGFRGLFVSFWPPRRIGFSACFSPSPSDLS